MDTNINKYFTYTNTVTPSIISEIAKPDFQLESLPSYETYVPNTTSTTSTTSSGLFLDGVIPTSSSSSSSNSTTSSSSSESSSTGNTNISSEVKDVPVNASVVEKAVAASKLGYYSTNNSFSNKITLKHDKYTGNCTWGPATFYHAAGIKLNGKWWQNASGKQVDYLHNPVKTGIYKAGFTKVKEVSDDDAKNRASEIAQPGDIGLIFTNDGHVHAEMWNGENWISDTILKNAWCYGNKKGKLEIWRYSGDNSQVSKAAYGMKLDSDTDDYSTDITNAVNKYFTYTNSVTPEVVLTIAKPNFDLSTILPNYETYVPSSTSSGSSSTLFLDGVIPSTSSGTSSTSTGTTSTNTGTTSTSTGTPSILKYKGLEINIDTVISKLRENSKHPVKHMCTGFVGSALKGKKYARGVGGARDPKDLYNILNKDGWTDVLGSNYTPLKGDIWTTWDPTASGIKNMHSSMFDGEKWISYSPEGTTPWYWKNQGKGSILAHVMRYTPGIVSGGATSNTLLASNTTGTNAKNGGVLSAKKGTKTKLKNYGYPDDIAKDTEFMNFIESLSEEAPNLLPYTTAYNTYRAWQLNGKPKNFEEALLNGMYGYVDEDKSYHANSVYQDENGDYEFMKEPDHNTRWMELDWYNNGPKNSESYPYMFGGEDPWSDWTNFRKNYIFEEATDGKPAYYRLKSNLGPMDLQALENAQNFNLSTQDKISSKKDGGTMEIIIEKEEKKEDPIGCLLCEIMNSLGLRHHALKETKPNMLPDILGGNAEIIIKIGGPEKAYEEDGFESMLKDILPMVSLTKHYTEKDVEEKRKSKDKQPESVKKILSLMNNGNILKALRGMQVFKNGGNFNDTILLREAISGDLITIDRRNLNSNQSSGKAPIETNKGTIYIINNKAYYAKNIDPRIKKNAEGGQVEEVSTVECSIGDHDYILFEAKTEEEKEKGLMGVTKLEDNEGMIFYYDKPLTVSFWMKDTEIPLDICFFNEDYECISIKSGHPLSEKPIEEKNVQFVVEVPAGSDIKPGDELDLPGDEDDYVMHVIGSDGLILYSLKGGERIVSRRETKILIKKAKRAYNAKDDYSYDAKCRSLGKYIFKVLDGQDGRDAEYVTLDSKKD